MEMEKNHYSIKNISLDGNETVWKSADIQNISFDGNKTVWKSYGNGRKPF